MLFLEVVKCWTLLHIKILIFNTTSKIKTSQMIVCWSNCEIKMPQNIVLRLNHENKMLRNPKIAEKFREIKTQRKFNAAKISCLELYARNFKYGFYERNAKSKSAFFKRTISKEQALKKRIILRLNHF